MKFDIASVRKALHASVQAHQKYPCHCSSKAFEGSLGRAAACNDRYFDTTLKQVMIRRDGKWLPLGGG